MSEKAINLNRRTFVRKFLVGAGGIAALGGIAPSILIPDSYAGQAIIVAKGSDFYGSLASASIARPFDIGTWSSMRLSMRFSMEFSASLTSLTPRLVVGLCSGSANQVFDATTTNFFGIRTNPATWTYAAASPDSLSCGTNAFYATKRVSSTWTNSTNPINSGNLLAYRTSELSEGNASALIVEINKGSPNYTAKATYPNTTFSNVTIDTWLTQVVAVTPSITNHLSWPSAQSVAFDEVAGTLDHICIGWDRSEASLDIYDICVVKMAA